MMSIQNKPGSRLVFQTELDQICGEKNTESIHSLIGDYQLTVRSWSGVWIHYSLIAFSIFPNWCSEIEKWCSGSLYFDLSESHQITWLTSVWRGTRYHLYNLEIFQRFGWLLRYYHWEWLKLSPSVECNRMLEDSMQIVLIWSECMIRRAQDNLACITASLI